MNANAFATDYTKRHSSAVLTVRKSTGIVVSIDASNRGYVIEEHGIHVDELLSALRTCCPPGHYIWPVSVDYYDDLGEYIGDERVPPMPIPPQQSSSR